MKLNKEQLYKKKLPLGAYISIIHRQHQIYLNKVASEKDITAGQGLLLLHLLNVKTSSQNEIAENYRIDKGSIARSIRKLEDKGIVQREIDDSNRKKYIVSLTEKGEEIARYIKKSDEEWEKSVLRDLEIEEDSFIYGLKAMAFTSLELTCEEGEK